MKQFEMGGCYFMLSFSDHAGSIPIVETYIFAGKNLMEGDKHSGEETWYFKTPDGFAESAYVLTSENLQDFIRIGSDAIELVLDKAQLIDQLQQK